MRIEELDPKKFYAIVVDSPDIAAEDLTRLENQFKNRGVYNIVALADGSPSSQPPRYWGILWKPVGRNPEWLKQTTGHVDFYPSPAIAQARADDFFEPQNCEVREFVG